MSTSAISHRASGTDAPEEILWPSQPSTAGREPTSTSSPPMAGLAEAVVP